MIYSRIASNNDIEIDDEYAAALDTLAWSYKVGWKKCINSMLNIIFDSFIILITIADIVTNIYVLMLFYQHGQKTFFILSLTILIITHGVQTFFFLVRYDVSSDIESSCLLSVMFLLLFPFGPIQSFIMFFTENPDSWFSKKCSNITGFDMENSIKYHNYSKSNSKIGNWIITKISKHFGFLIQGLFESIPQSLLQIVAIILYKDVNRILIISIYVSILSVMIKSLIVSLQIIELKTYIWTWLCVLTDFVGIFFTLVWIFYTNDEFMVNIKQVWIYQILSSTTPPIIIALLWWFLDAMWAIIDDIWQNSSYEGTEKISHTFFVVIVVSIGVILLSGVVFIGSNILCFSFPAMLILFYGTLRWDTIFELNVYNSVNAMLKFINQDPNERVLRILAINSNIDAITSNINDASISNYINTMEKLHGVKAVEKIGYDDIRNNCGDDEHVRFVKIYPAIWHWITDISPKISYIDWIVCKSKLSKDKIIGSIVWLIYVMCWIFFIAFVYTKWFQIIFPFIVVVCLQYYTYWNQVGLFELILLGTYIGLELIVFVLGIMVCRAHWWLWHICPGNEIVKLKPKSIAIDILKPANEWYGKICIARFILQMFGDDIGMIIMDYFYNIDLNQID